MTNEEHARKKRNLNRWSLIVGVISAAIGVVLIEKGEILSGVCVVLIAVSNLWNALNEVKE